MDDEKAHVHFHIVHSVKGGCGKTAFSLFWALSKANNSKIDGSGGSWHNKARVLFIDADFKGTSLKYLLYDSAEAAHYPTKEEIEIQLVDLGGSKSFNQFAFAKKKEEVDCICLNDLLSGEYRSQVSDLIVESIVYEIPEEYKYVTLNGRVDFIFSSSKAEDKNIFRYSDNVLNGQMIQLSEGRFANNMKMILNWVLRKGRGKSGEGQYTDIVIDMPPGYDSYSELLLREMKMIKKAHKNVDICYYLATTNDRGHLYAMKECLRNTMQMEQKEPVYTSIDVVLCCTAPADFENHEVVVDDLLKELWWSHEKNNIYLSEYAQDYRDFCRNINKCEFGYTIRKLA